MCVVDDRTDKVEAFSLKASDHFDVTVIKNLTMLTIRHYQKELVEELVNGFQIVLQQQTPETIQLLLSTTNHRIN